ncbi:MAG: dynamin family protein [Candidatus Muiribacteriota bacterium]
MENEKLNELKQQVDELAKFFKWNKSELKNNIKSNVSGIFDELGEFEKAKENLESELKSLNQQNEKLFKFSRKLKNEKKKMSDEIETLNINLNELKKKYDLVVEKFKTLESENNQIKKKYNDVSIKYNLISEILSASSVFNEDFNKFRSLLRNEFLDFANEESSLAEEAQAILMMQAVEKRLELIVSFSNIYNKNIIAIGGGFSSGKSAFVNSFFNDKELKLPIGINPVTAIPTYIIPGEVNHIKGYSQNGGVIDIERGFYEELSHDFVKSFQFNLKDIMPFMALETSIRNLDKLCFIDTPGYNPSDIDQGFTSEDKNTASEYLAQANSMIWMVGLDSNGTIPSSDLEFLDDLDLEGKKLYIVANKADLRSESDLEDVLDEIEDSLDDYDIDFSGISAFSSNLRHEYMNRKLSLFDFLKGENKILQTEKEIISEIEKVFKMYQSAITQDIDDRKNIISQINSLELDMLESGFDSTDSTVDNRIEELKKSFKIKQLEKQQKEMFSIKKLILESVNELFSKINRK